MNSPSASSGEQPVLRIKGVGKVFGRYAALRDISIDFLSGRFYGLLGPNGAGKSTLLRMAAGLLSPSAGSLSVTCPAHSIGLMSHASLLYDELNALENLSYFAGLYQGISQDRCRRLLHAVGLDAGLKRYVRDYSQGMKQRLSLARALINDPKLLLLDEPFSNVDADSSQLMLRALAERRDAGACILVVTHQASLLHGFADELITLSEGRILTGSKLSYPAEVQA